MATPGYVPLNPLEETRSYESPPWREQPWLQQRPGEVARQPRGEQFGYQGPDQGYVYVLARQFRGKLHLTPGISEDDALVGAISVALKRASVFGRAPVVHDLRLALALWGFLTEAPAELVELRKPLFEEVADPHHYADQRRIADVVPETTLRATPDEVVQAVADGRWRSLLDL
jgi:hypothetical protein